MIKMIIATVILLMLAGCATVSGFSKDLGVAAEWTKEKMK